MNKVEKYNDYHSFNNYHSYKFFDKVLNIDKSYIDKLCKIEYDENDNEVIHINIDINNNYNYKKVNFSDNVINYVYKY